jgi:putative endopeptidase
MHRPFVTARALAAVLWMAIAALPAVAAGRAMPALDPADMDTTVSPCRDFYQYANGGWLAHHEIPAAFANWGSFTELAESNRERLHQILEEARRDRRAKSGSDMARLGVFYAAAMDSTGAEAAGLAPVQALLDAIDGLKAPADLAGEVAWLHGHGIRAMFFFRTGQDPRRSDLVIPFASQGGLGLPDRDYYTRSDSTSAAMRDSYVGHIGRTLSLAGVEPAAARAQAERIVALETVMAKASMTNVQRRDPVATYHKMPLASLQNMTPRFDWSRYLSGRGAPAIDSIDVTQPDFFDALDALVGQAPLADWKAYLRWCVLDDAAPLLTTAFADEDFSFQRLLTGAQVMQPRWKRSLALTDRDLGDILGREYVKRYFPPAARERALKMVRNLEAALGDRIEALEWMGPETRRRALDKLHAFEERIGYPDQWREYPGLEIGESVYANHLSAQDVEARRNIDKLGKPVDRGEWRMTAPTVNAFYMSSLNSINFPAGILQPPFFDPSWDDAVNYGAIGAVIGHEMTHGFDDRGRQFDAQGNLDDWWTAEDAARYKERADKVVAQFNHYTVLDTLHLNGRLTLGENIADLGGLAVAYAALQKALAGKSPGTIDGFTSDQRFFLSWARVWRTLQRDEALRTQVLTNPHSPAMWRVNGPLSNLPQFAKAFGCSSVDAMVRAEDARAQIW